MQLEPVRIPPGSQVIWYGEWAHIILPKGLVEIKPWTFRGCVCLWGIEFSEELDIIGDGAFYGCQNLYKMTAYRKPTHVGLMAFKGCSDLNPIDLLYLTNKTEHGAGF